MTAQEAKIDLAAIEKKIEKGDITLNEIQGINDGIDQEIARLNLLKSKVAGLVTKALSQFAPSSAKKSRGQGQKKPRLKDEQKKKIVAAFKKSDKSPAAFAKEWAEKNPTETFSGNALKSWADSK